MRSGRRSCEVRRGTWDGATKPAKLAKSTRAKSTRAGIAFAGLACAGITCAGVTMLAPREASAAEPRTWNYLTTGNGHGFQIFDANKKRIVSFLDHPYRYVRPRQDPRSDGIGRRNLAYDFYFGLKGPGGAGWLVDASSADPSYVDESNIIRVPGTLAGVSTESFYFAPFGFEGNAFVALMHAEGATDGFALFNFHMGNGQPDPDANGESLRAGDGGALVEAGPGGGALIYVPISAGRFDCQNVEGKVRAGQDLGSSTSCAGTDVVPAFQAKLDGGWMGVAVLYVERPEDATSTQSAFQQWLGGRTPAKVLEAARAEFEAWRKPPSKDVALCTDDEKRLWRQSEAVLRMGQVREPRIAGRKNTGMVLASLPPGEWHTGWVRDAIYAIVALARMGHHDEARLAMDFLLNAGPVGKFKQYVSNADYRISVCRYFGTGEEEGDYSGQQTPNVETDGWGMTLWAARQYVEASGDLAWLASTTTYGDTVYDAMLKGIAEAVEKNLEPNAIMKADSSIWEVHDENKRHYAYTTMANTRGLCDFAAIAKKAGKPEAQKYRDLAAKMNKAFLQTFVDPQGALVGSLEGLSTGKYYDGAVAEAFTWNLLPDFTGNTAKATLRMLNNLRVDSGGFKRNNDGLSSYDDNEWILVDLRIANALRRAGRGAEGDAIVAMVREKAKANFNLLPELYNAVQRDGQIGKYTGSIPMVGYGGGAYVITMMDRSGVVEPNDCGDGKGVTLPKVTCGGVSTDVPAGTPGAPGGPGTGGGPGDPGTSDPGASTGVEATGAPGIDEVPYVKACLCASTTSTRTASGPAFLAAALAWIAGKRRAGKRRDGREIAEGGARR